LGAIVCVAGVWLALKGGLPEGGEGSTPAPVIADGRDAGRSGPGAVAGNVAAIENEVEALFAASSMLPTSLDAEIASIGLDAAALGLGLADPMGAEPGGTADPLGSFGGSWGGGSL
jgi:hypothetical protein